jgi:diguanylate cyclase (GGDEF)-like protein
VAEPGQRPDGSEYWVEVYGIVTERDVAGRPLRLIGVTADVTRRKEAELRLAHLALQDHLTGLPNRRALDESLEQAIARARRGDESLALMLLDLDGFKRVNDRLGHLAGDKVLSEAARRLRLCVRRSDVVARFGGDEFAVVAAGFGKRRRLERLAVRIVEVLSGPVQLAGATAQVGVSIGVAVFPEDGASPVELLGRADAALYAAKRARSGFRFAAELDEGGEPAILAPR